MKTITLYYRNAAENADKVYIISLVEAGGGEFRVDYQNGKRGGTLASGTKTRIPVSRALAENIFARLVAEKTRGGYTGSPDGQPFGGDAARLAKVLPHPSKEMVTLQTMRNFSARDFLIQRKMDGELDKFTVAGAEILCEWMKRKSGGFYTADDLAMFDKFPDGWRAAFTVATVHGENVLARSTRERWGILCSFESKFPPDMVLCRMVDVPDALGAAEGYVAHAWDAPWGNMLCVKQAQIYLCRVTRTGGTQSVGICDSETGQDRGNVKLGGGKCDQVRCV